MGTDVLQPAQSSTPVIPDVNDENRQHQHGCPFLNDGSSRRSERPIAFRHDAHAADAAAATSSDAANQNLPDFGMPKKKQPELTQAEQFKRFREAAKRAEADESDR